MKSSILQKTLHTLRSFGHIPTSCQFEIFAATIHQSCEKGKRYKEGRTPPCWSTLSIIIQSIPILIQSRQSCCNLVQSSIVKFLYNPVQSIQSKHNWGTHRGIVPKTGISWQTTWGSNPITIAKAKMTFQNGSMQGSDQPKSLSLHFHNPPQSRNYFFTIGSDCERIMWLQQRQALILICNFTLVTIEKTYFAIQSDCVRILD